MKTLSFVSIDVWTILFTWVNLIILSLILKKLLFQPVARILEQRDLEIQQLYYKAEHAERQAHKFQQKYREKMEEAGREASDLLDRAEKNARIKEEAVLLEAREKAGRIIHDGQQAVLLGLEKQKKENREKIAGIAIAATEQILQRKLTEKDYESLVLKTIDELEDAS